MEWKAPSPGPTTCHASTRGRGMREMRVDGACHCGRITYEAEVDADNVLICHCTDCQTLSGSAFRTVAPALPGTFRLLTGAPKTYIKVAESGVERAQVFCADCGSPIYSGPVGGGSSFVGIRVGTIRQRDRLPPRKQVWCRSAQGWLQQLSSLEKLQTQ